MTSISDEQIKASIACAHQFKTNVCRTATKFKQLRMRLLESLQSLNSTDVRILTIFHKI
jgi:hypothetical protein